MFEVHIIPDAAFVKAFNPLRGDAPIVGLSFRLSFHTLKADAEKQFAFYQTQYPGYSLIIVEV